MQKVLRGLLLLALFAQCSPTERNFQFFVSPSGNDRDDGTRNNPWKTIERLNEADLEPGDIVYLESGATFNGPVLLDSLDFGSRRNPVVMTSTDSIPAIINAGSGTAIEVKNTQWISLVNLKLVGAGRKGGNTSSGLAINYSDGILTSGIDVSGFQKSGLSVHSSRSVTVVEVVAHDNGFAGISVSGDSTKRDSHDILISKSVVFDNAGDPTNVTNHSGNGIIVGMCSDVRIEYCTATNNGWDMPRVGNGPVGIWAWEADNVIIEHCLSYRNKTSAGGEDGGGFDLDGGVTNSIIQHCLSYENAGSGYGLFQYPYASEWKNNIVRFNISINDGLTSAAHAGIYVWNGEGDDAKFSDAWVYNNTVYNKSGAAIRYSPDSKRHRFNFVNNILIAGDTIVNGPLNGDDRYVTNCRWSLEGRYNFVSLSGKKGSLPNELSSITMNPGFTPDPEGVFDAQQIESFIQCDVKTGSKLFHGGLLLNEMVGFGLKEYTANDYHGGPVPDKGIGACFSVSQPQPKANP